MTIIRVQQASLTKPSMGGGKDTENYKVCLLDPLEQCLFGHSGVAVIYSDEIADLTGDIALHAISPGGEGGAGAL
eukprot:1184191-Prorocentrum_minimum.AAC.2